MTLWLTLLFTSGDMLKLPMINLKSNYKMEYLTINIKVILCKESLTSRLEKKLKDLKFYKNTINNTKLV